MSNAYSSLRAYTIDEIISAICEVAGMSFDEITAPGSERNRADFRHLICFYLIKYAGMKHEEIAAILKKHRTTAYNGDQAVKNYIDAGDSKIIDLIHKIDAILL